jgi:hypothetical protein
MVILHLTLFSILVLCFPVSVGALFRMILKKVDARLTALLATSLLLCVQYALTRKIGSIGDNPSMIPNMSLATGLLSVASALAPLIVYY